MRFVAAQIDQCRYAFDLPYIILNFFRNYKIASYLLPILMKDQNHIGEKHEDI